MKFCAIICEYNPFHNGHAYQIQKAREISGCEGILCIMGGNFSQRGEPAITDKYTRAKMAIAGGADAVVQIPTYLCSTNAEIFAKTAVKIALSFKNVTHLCFGSECGDINSIVELATLLYKEPAFFKAMIKRNLNLGYSLGMSKTKAISECIDNNTVKFTRPKVVNSLLESPNNILAVEYVKAMLGEKDKHIQPITIQRVNNDDFYNDCDMKLSNATTIRSALHSSKRMWNVRKYIPNVPYKILAERLSTVSIPDMHLYSQLALYKLSTTNANELQSNYDVVEGIENKLIQTARESSNYESFVEMSTNRRFTVARIQRITIATLLNLRSEYVKHIYDIDYLPYVKVLAIKNKDEIISSISKSKSTVVLRKLDAIKAQNDPYAKILMYAEDRANILYGMLLSLNKDQKQDLARTSDIFEKTIFVEDEDIIDDENQDEITDDDIKSATKNEKNKSKKSKNESAPEITTDATTNDIVSTQSTQPTVDTQATSNETPNEPTTQTPQDDKTNKKHKITKKSNSKPNKS